MKTTETKTESQRRLARQAAIAENKKLPLVHPETGKATALAALKRLAAEHAALCAVAEAAEPALKELQDLAENGIDLSSGLVKDNKVTVCLDAYTLCALRDALAELARVRGSGVAK